MATGLPCMSARYPKAATSSALATFRFLKSLEFSSEAAASKPVRVGPGHRAVTVTPLPLSSLDKASEKDNTKVLVA